MVDVTKGMRPFKIKLQINNNDPNDVYGYVYLCICMHIHVGAGNELNELEGDHRESNPCKGKFMDYKLK